jgi:hypothetical protein
MAVWTGLEPATSCVTGRHSNQLNYQTNIKLTVSKETVLASLLLTIKSHDPYGTRTRVTSVKGRCLNHLTKGPYIESYFAKAKNYGEP